MPIVDGATNIDGAMDQVCASVWQSGRGRQAHTTVIFVFIKVIHLGFYKGENNVIGHFESST